MFRHVALYADDLRTAEDFYRLVFAAEVLFRATLPLGASWDDATEAGVEIQMVALGHEAFVLPIFAGTSSSRIIGLEATIDEIRALRRRLPREARLVTDEERQLVFVDPFEVEWQLSAASSFRSSGDMCGRWLVVPERSPPP